MLRNQKSSEELPQNVADNQFLGTHQLMSSICTWNLVINYTIHEKRHTDRFTYCSRFGNPSKIGATSSASRPENEKMWKTVRLVSYRRDLYVLVWSSKGRRRTYRLCHIQPQIPLQRDCFSQNRSLFCLPSGAKSTNTNMIFSFTSTRKVINLRQEHNLRFLLLLSCKSTLLPWT